VNLRKDHYRDRASEPDLPPRVYLPYVALAGRRAPARYRLRPARARRGTFETTLNRRRPSELADDKTFNNGSLGSGIDEERSEMR